MKRFTFLCKCAKWDPLFILKLAIAWILSKIWAYTKWESLLKVEEYLLCSSPYVLYTPYGTYYCSALLHYAALGENVEPELQEIIARFKKVKQSNNYCITIGANIWRFAIDAALNYWFKIIAFEPSPDTYHNFRINMALSNVEEYIESYNVWLWNMNSELSFVTWEKCDTMAHFIENNDLGTKKMSGSTGKTITVPVKKFDDLGITEEKIENTRLIIIDTEGFEFNVLMWMKESLKKFKNVQIIVEIREHKKEKQAILSLMRELWYHVKQLDNEDYLFEK